MYGNFFFEVLSEQMQDFHFLIELLFSSFLLPPTSQITPEETNKVEIRVFLHCIIPESKCGLDNACSVIWGS